MSETTDDAVLGGRLRLLQPRRGHRVGHDAILLAAATAARPDARLVDLGAGVGAAGLAVAIRVPGLALTLVERDHALAALALKNAARNGLADRVRVVCCDLTATQPELVLAGLAPASADAVLMNPPFNDPARQVGSPDPRRRAAHLGAVGSLHEWVATAAWLLRPGGALTVIFKADRLAELTAALDAHFRGVTILPVCGKPAAPPIRVIARVVKGVASPTATLPVLTLTEATGRPSAAAEQVLRNGTALRLDV